MKTITKYTLLLLSTVAGFSTLRAATLPTVDPLAQANDATAQLVSLHDGTFVGGTYDAYYGVVQVQATIKGGAIVDSTALKFPNHSGTSRAINRQALPYLLQEVTAKKSARVDIIGGATLTSRAYIASLRDALKKAGN